MRKKQMSDETRRMIVAKYDSGKTPKEISDVLDVKYETVRSVIRTYVRFDRINIVKRRASKPKKVTEEIEGRIKSLIENDVSITLKSIKAHIFQEKGITVSLSTIERSIKNLNFSLKRVCLIPEARNTDSNLEARFCYASEYLLLDEEKILFLDEMGVNCSLRLSYGRSTVGTPARKVVRAIRSKNYSICAGISKQGIIHYETKNQAFNGDLFCTFLTNLFLKMNELNLKNFTIIMDNVAFHRIANVRDIICENGHNFLFLPPYSPQLNAIEEFFSKWKYYVKSANVNNVVELVNAIDRGVSSVSSLDCNGFFLDVKRHALKALRREDF